MGDRDDRRRTGPWRTIWSRILTCMPTVSDLGALVALAPAPVLLSQFTQTASADDLERLWSDIAEYLAGLYPGLPDRGLD